MSHTPRANSPFTGRTPTGRRPGAPLAIRTADQIARSLPLVRSIIGTIQEVAQKLHATLERATDCVDRLDEMGPLIDRDAYLMDLGDEIHLLQEDLTAQARELEDLGGFLVDPQTGSVDFFAELNGQAISYCWRPEDAGLEYVHDRNDDCDQRVPLD